MIPRISKIVSFIDSTSKIPYCTALIDLRNPTTFDEKTSTFYCIVLRWTCVKYVKFMNALFHREGRCMYEKSPKQFVPGLEGSKYPRSAQILRVDINQAQRYIFFTEESVPATFASDFVHNPFWRFEKVLPCEFFSKATANSQKFSDEKWTGK